MPKSIIRYAKIISREAHVCRFCTVFNSKRIYAKQQGCIIIEGIVENKRIEILKLKNREKAEVFLKVYKKGKETRTSKTLLNVY